MPEIKGIEELLNEARELLHEAGAKHPLGGLWRERVSAWGVESTTWLTGFKGHQGELTEMQLDPGIEGRVGKLETALTQLALSMLTLQTLAMVGGGQQQGPSKWQVAQDLDPEAEVELLDGSKIKVKDVPLGPDGMPEEEWAMANCPCPTHEERRSRKAAAEQQTKGGTGLYL